MSIITANMIPLSVFMFVAALPFGVLIAIEGINVETNPMNEPAVITQQ